MFGQVTCVTVQSLIQAMTSNAPNSYWPRANTMDDPSAEGMRHGVFPLGKHENCQNKGAMKGMFPLSIQND